MRHLAKTVAISRQQGSGGSYVGRAVAERLGFRYIDREMLRNAAEYLRTHDPAEQVGRAPSSWWSRLGQTFVPGGPDCGYVPPSSEAIYEGELFEIERRIIRELAEGQDAVIVGRGAAQTLRGRAGVLAVFLHAPQPWRVARVRQVYGITDERAAQRMVHDSDRNRARFIRALAGLDWTDACGYDLAADTSAMGFEPVVDLIVRAVGAPGRDPRAGTE